MALEKLKITPFRKKQGKKFERAADKEISVLFNPNSYSIMKSVTWTPPQTSTGERAETQRKVNAPTLSFGGGGSRQLTLELFFDVTEPINGKAIDDVRKETDKIVALTRIDPDQGQPPVCEVFWGKAATKDFPFIGVISNLTQRFTLFRSDGTPVRASLTVVFLEFLDPEMDKRQTDPELTTSVVKRGDTLSSIAAEVYRDPMLWRIIAEANRLDNPRRLEVGKPLTIPKLR
jgi:hypothetical protein